MPFRLGMLGMWHVHADGIVRQVALHPDEFRLSGFFDGDPQVVAARSLRWAPLLPGFRVYESAEELLREPLDGIVIEGRIHENLRLARQALEAHRPVLLEKPAGDDGLEFRRLIELARRRNLHLQMLYLFRGMSAVQALVSRAAAGDLGEIYEFRGRLPKESRHYDEYVADLGRYAGGIFFEMAGHLVDLAVTLLGTPRNVVSLMRHHGAAVPDGFVDHGLALLEFDRSFATIEVPALEVATGSRRIEVYGTQGAAVIPHLGSGHLENSAVQPLEIFLEHVGRWERVDLPQATLQLGDLREFAAVVAGCRAPAVTVAHDLLVQETLLRACGMA